MSTSFAVLDGTPKQDGATRRAFASRHSHKACDLHGAPSGRNAIKTIFVAVSVTAILLSRGLIAQSTGSPVGSWRLVSAWATSADGRRNDTPFGSSPTGALTYTSNGRMMAIVSYSGRQPLSGADRIASPLAERAEAFTTSFAYAGRYTLTSDKVIHHVEVATVENWVNTDLVRIIKFDGNRLTLQTPPLSVGGVMQTSELVWERIP